AGGLRRVLPYLGVAALLTGVALGLVLRPRHGAATVHEPATTSPITTDRSPPDHAAYRDESVDSEQRRQVTEALVDLAGRFGVADASGPSRDNPVVLMNLLSDRLRYRGIWLSAAEQAQLNSGAHSGSDQALALKWHELVRRFATDRPLPADFARGPLAWQLD